MDEHERVAWNICRQLDARLGEVARSARADLSGVAPELPRIYAQLRDDIIEALAYAEHAARDERSRASLSSSMRPETIATLEQCLDDDDEYVRPSAPPYRVEDWYAGYNDAPFTSGPRPVPNLSVPTNHPSYSQDGAGLGSTFTPGPPFVPNINIASRKKRT
jgi:hypothetical protein